MPELPIRGVQVNELVTTTDGALDRLSPGSRNRAGSSGAPVSRPTRSSRYLCVGVGEAAGDLQVAPRIDGDLDLDARRDHAGGDVVLRAGAGGVARIRIRCVPRSAAQPLMFWTRKTEPLNVLSWKFWNSCRNSATFTMKLRWVYLAPSSKASTISGSNCRFAVLKPALRPPNWRGSVGEKIGWPSAERSRLKPPAL